MRVMKHRKRIILFALTLLVAMGMSRPMEVLAKEATVTFGSNWYEKKSGETFPVGVYINSDNGVGEYQVTIKYNPLRLKYLEGADEADEENDILTLSGERGEEQIKYWLKFTALSGGDTTLTVDKAEIYVGNTEDEMYEITAYGKAPIKVSGEDTVAEEEEEDTPDTQETVTPQTRENTSDDEQIEKRKKPNIFYNIYVVVILAVIAMIVIVELIIIAIRKLLGKNKKSKKQKPEENYRPLKVSDLEDDAEIIDLRREIQNIVQERGIRKQLGEPVIKIEDVTMEFHLASSNPSSLKEYLIQVAKRQITYRKLYALYHVSFNVYKGEVVGIIGTNGSGKSTLLKIVSGALKPTSGNVEVDRKKVQLLTLGTGFDMELTAKENVYLNGSIIGYSREFLDEHYDDIVEFAELQDFMEEKVKNFSSGMVSRLGFAIATAGDAAEILILDEVLSVGDEFFRQKSLRRIKEMIHGGSTVLMVSHGMDTILDNCTKCVWIEKGKLQMMGEPKVVCEAYRKIKDT